MRKGTDLFFEFVPHNEFGVLEHTIRFDSGLELTNPMRIVANGNGSELMFTLFQNEGMSDQRFSEDVESVEKDLETIRRIMESR